MSTRNQTVRSLIAAMCLAALTACAAATTPPAPRSGDAGGSGNVEGPESSTGDWKDVLSSDRATDDEEPSPQPRCDLDTPMSVC
jgi:hypothetical protein